MAQDKVSEEVRESRIADYHVLNPPSSISPFLAASILPSTPPSGHCLCHSLHTGMKMPM